MHRYAAGCAHQPLRRAVECLPHPSRQPFFIKGSHYSAVELLGDAARFAGGICLIFRLMPANYHRYCFIDDAALEECGAIPGALHCVRPIALEREPVYAHNSRAWTLMRTDHFGTVAQIEIGALLVGRIVNEPFPPGTGIRRGQEKGRFKFGGSTIALLFEPGRIALNALFCFRTEVEEHSVRQGQAIGRSL